MTVDVAVRLGITGSKEVERAFNDIGRKGSQELKDLRKAANDLSPPMVAISRSVGVAKDRIDDLVASSGNFGRVATSFGGWGTAAAVAFTAVAAAATIAFSKAKEAAAFADDLDDTATKLGTTTDALQEYQFAIVDAGGSAEDANAALDGFNVALGAAQSGLSKKAIKPFAALGFTREELQQVRVGSDLIPEIAERISKLGSFAEQAAVADKLGLKPLLPLLLQGRDGIEALKNKAHELGAVMDADIVTTGAEANKQLELTARVIKAQLLTAFVDMAPVLVQFGNTLAYVAGLFNTLISKAPDSVGAIDKRIDAITKSIADARRRLASPSMLDNVVNMVTGASDQQFIKEGEKQLAILRDQKAKLAAEMKNLPAPANAGGTSLIDVSAPAADGAAAKSTAQSDVQRRAADIARQRQEDARMIVSLMGEEERAAYDLKNALADLDAARARGNITSDAERDRLKSVVQGRYDAAKAAREQTAAEAAARQRAEAEQARQAAISGIAGYRRAAESPEQARAREIADLDAARAAARGLKEEMTDGEYENALKRINDQYAKLKIGLYEATLQGQLMNGVLSGQISSWQDVERFALQALRSIIAQASQAASVGGSGGGLGGFFSELGKAAAGLFGVGGGGSFNTTGFGAVAMNGGLATGGPFYGGDTRWTGERGPEIMRSRSDGFVYDAATSAAAMRSAPASASGGSSGGAIGVTLNNHSSTPLQAQARETRDERGNRRVEVTLQEQARGMIDARFNEMIDGKRDDQRLARSFGVRRQLSGA